MNSNTKNLLALSEEILKKTTPVEKVTRPDYQGNLVSDDGIKDIVVPDQFVNQLLGFNEALNESSDLDKKKEKMPEFTPITKDVLANEKLEALVENLKTLLKEAREVLLELTATGSLGHAAKSSKRKKRRFR
tara:strand:- start:1219 stop:1614 length:396 start_codon:yes stop_codon:yes gene_type:complete